MDKVAMYKEEIEKMAEKKKMSKKKKAGIYAGALAAGGGAISVLGYRSSRKSKQLKKLLLKGK